MSIISRAQPRRWLVGTHKRLKSRPVHVWLPHARSAGVLVIPSGSADPDDSSHFLGYAQVDDYSGSRTTARIQELAITYGTERIGSASESDVQRMAEVRRSLSLAGLHPGEAAIFTDKFLMRRRAASSGLASPTFNAVDFSSFRQLLADADRLGWPVVVKPRRGSGGRGVQVLNSPGELDAWFSQARSSDSCDWLIEQFVSGDVFHIDGLTQFGEIVHAWPSRYNRGAAEALAMNLTQNSRLLGIDDPLARVLLDFAASLVRAFPHLEDLSAFHLEAFVRDGCPILCEVACRPGGAGVDEVYTTAFGSSLVEQHLKGQLALSSISKPNLLPSVYAGWTLLPALGKRLLRRGGFPEGLAIVKAGLPAASQHTKAREITDAAGLLVVKGTSPEVVDSSLNIVEEWWVSETQWET